MTERIANGLSIEIENEFDVVLSKKTSFHWFGKLIIFLILLVVFFPVAIFYLAVVLIRGITKGPVRMRFSIDEYGDIQPKNWQKIAYWKTA